MGIWTTVVNTSRSALRGSGKVLVYAGTHPKRALLTGAAGYAGWEYLVQDRPLIDSAGDIAGKAAEVTFGEERVNKAEAAAESTVSAVSDTIDAAGAKIDHATEAITGAANTAREATGALSGVSNFFQGLTSGNGLGMIGNFFRNLATGNVGGLGIAGLIGAALLCFCRFGFFGKLLGGLLAMMVIGNNFRPAVSQAEQARPVQSRAAQTPQTMPMQQPEETTTPTLHRGR